MRENTGARRITTVNFAGGEAASHEWTEQEITQAYFATDVIGAYSAQHERQAHDVDYRVEFGFPQVFEYREAGLKVVALAHDGQVDTVFVIEDKDTARLHTAARTGRTMSMRYVKTDGSVGIRKIAVGSVRLTKGGFVTVRAADLKIGEDRTFRADRMTHTTLHRTVAAGAAAPSKAALAAAFAPARPAVSAVIPAPRTEEDTITVITDVYSTEPGYAAILEAPEEVQDAVAERYALGHAYAFVTI